MSEIAASLAEHIATWPAEHVVVGVSDRSRNRWLATNSGTEVDRPFPLASVTKALFSLAVLVAIEEGSVSLDEPAGPPGSTVRHLLSHASGLGPDLADDGGLRTVARPGVRRLYSNAGFVVLGRLLTERTGIDHRQYFRESVVEPLGLTDTILHGSPAAEATSTVPDLLLVANELLEPTLIHPSTLATATSAQFGELAGVLPGFGRQVPNPWGLGFELRGGKDPHWTAAENSPGTFGHFGRSGTMFWVDPVAGIGLVALTDQPFGPWAADAWPAVSHWVLGAHESNGP
ncbi:MAG: serine hydrolase [Actinomycetota bacterium]|nr:serine hydrolase [Actinomycetota bacterium]